jgi:protoheme IX farnesyltransferase
VNTSELFVDARSSRHSGWLSRVVPVVLDLFALTKPRITALVLVTEAAGLRLAPGHASGRTIALSLAGTALIVGSANTLNMWWEQDVDGRMARTRNRPLPAGRLSPDTALAFGLALALVSLPMLLLVNLTTALLGLVSLVMYVAAYTPLKRHSSMALLVGAVPGAMPPLMGWSTVTGAIGIGGVLLFAVLFLWQVPHFAAISIFRREDYARAGLQVVSVQRGERAARRTVALYAVLLAIVSLLFVPFGLAGHAYAVVAGLLGAGFVAVSLRGITASSRTLDVHRWAKLVFALSIPYLTLLVGTLVANTGP